MRSRILDVLCTTGFASGYASAPAVHVRLANAALRETILNDAHGDALDAVLCAAITALAVGSGQLPTPPEGWHDAYWQEGCIYY